ncbi:MAG: ABC transporter substrate-binding protein [Firmicutes bacterium]|nr:ABC transporter substrate-binding protein [Bacillota bacterium]
MSKRKFSVSILVTILLLAMAFTVSAEEPRMATWVDDVVLVEEPSITTAVTRLQTGDIDVYASTSSQPVPFATILSDPELDYYQTFGSYAELTFNVVGPEFDDGRYNPFGNVKIREAMNWILDRDYIAQELYGGLAIGKLTMLNRNYVDYSRVVESVRGLESKYAYDFELAKEVIQTEMMADGAKLVDGKWHYNGQPVEVIILARSEDQRASVGDYVADQLEAIGLTATVEYRTGAEASPIWVASDPWLGLWHVYTGGWVAGEVYRDQGHNFRQMFSPQGMSYTLWQEYDPTPEFEEIIERLYYKKFTSMEERNALFSRALELGLEFSPRIYTVDTISYLARRADVTVAADLAQGMGSTPLWPSTLRRGDEIGGEIRIGAQQLLVDPWNAVEGSNQSFDQLPIRATFDRGFISNPFTGSRMPHRAKFAEITLVEGLPVAKSPDTDWLTLEFVEGVELPHDNYDDDLGGIPVPADAWLYWDGDLGRWVTVGEKYPDGVTAKRHVVVHYRDDLYDTVTWHDGSPWTIADILLPVILDWDRGFEGSEIFDPSAEAVTKTDINNARGWRIVSVDPLVIEAWSNSWYIDAELNYSDYFSYLYNYGNQPWHTLALGVLAEANGELAFSVSKATALDVEHMGYNMGPSLPILDKWLDYAIENNYIPWADFLSEYISEEEIATRYANAKAWYQEKGHMWIGNGPMYLEAVYPTEKVVHLKRYENYSERADKFAMFDQPRIAEAEVTGPSRVRAGNEVAFEVEVTFEGEPYAMEFIQEVKYIVLDATGAVAASGYATPIADGLFEIVLTAEQTEALPIGSNTVEAIVLPTLVASATFGQHTFVTLP